MTCTADYTWRGRKSEWAQLMSAAQGMLTVHTDSGWWVAPTHQAVWIPAGVANSAEMGGRVVLRDIYLRAALARRLPATCRVVRLSPLLRELMRRIIELRTLDRRIREQGNLLEVLLDQLAALEPAPLDLPMPRDLRALRAAELMRKTPSTRPATAAILREAGASTRTLERLFLADTGLSFGAWRQRARLLRALQVLADGASVTRAGIAVGYAGTSAFVAAFRRVFGTPPGRYLRRQAE